MRFSTLFTSHERVNIRIKTRYFYLQIHSTFNLFLYLFFKNIIAKNAFLQRYIVEKTPIAIE